MRLAAVFTVLALFAIFAISASAVRMGRLSRKHDVTGHRVHALVANQAPTVWGKEQCVLKASLQSA
jgi:hypothetical protein